MRFFDRPGGFVEIIIPQIVQKEKRQTRKPAASMRFREKTHPIEITVSHIKHFVNAFEPVAYRRPAVMGLRCNVRQRKTLNVPQ